MDEFAQKTGMSADEFMRKQGGKAVTLKTVMNLIDPILDQVVALEKSDANSLLATAAMKQLESQSLAVRDYTTALLYSRTEAEPTDGKKVAKWLR
jgi:hypothetical protein